MTVSRHTDHRGTDIGTTPNCDVCHQGSQQSQQKYLRMISCSYVLTITCSTLELIQHRHLLPLTLCLTEQSTYQPELRPVCQDRRIREHLHVIRKEIKCRVADNWERREEKKGKEERPWISRRWQRRRQRERRKNGRLCFNLSQKKQGHWATDAEGTKELMDNCIFSLIHHIRANWLAELWKICKTKIDWLIEQGLTSPPTQYRLYGRRFYRSKDPTNSIKVLKEHTEYTINRKNTISTQ